MDLPTHPNPAADAILLAHRQEALLEVFPQLSQSASSVQSDQLNRSLGSIARELQIDRDLRVQSKARADTKDISTLVGEFGVAKLLRLRQVPSVAALPGIWATLANTPKAQRLMALQWEVDRVKSQLRDHHLIFIVTNPLFEIVKSLGFEMVDNDSVDTGLNPFLLKDEDKRQVVSEQVYFSQIYSSEAAPSRQDIDVLSKAKPGAPLLPVQLRQQVKRLQVLHGVLFGMNSIHVTALNSYLEQLVTREAEVYRLMATTPLLPVLLAKKLTVQHNTWLRNQALSDVPLSAPFYDRIFDDIDMENRWEPTLTPKFLERIGLGEVDPSFASSNTFHPSPAPAPAPLPGPSSANNNENRDTTVNNPQFNEELFGRVRNSRMSCRIMRQQIRDGQLPELPSSKVDQLPICLAYHAKGQCNQRCGRKVDHVPYSAAEYEPLANWCNTNWPQEESAQS